MKHTITAPTSLMETSATPYSCFGQGSEKMLSIVTQWHPENNTENTIYRVQDHEKIVEFNNLLAALDFYNNCP